MKFEKTNVLVTGTSGLIGGYIYQELKKNDSLNMINVGRAVIADLTGLDTVNSLEKLGSADVMVHCAARIPSSNISMDNVVETNRKIDSNIYQYCKNTKTKCIFISSMSVYADYGKAIPIDETMPLLTKGNGYSLEKVNSEKLFMELNNTIIFRVSSPYGIRQKFRNVLKIFIENIKQNEDICYYSTGSRTQDFIHGLDIASAVVRAIQKNVAGIYNIVSGESISMKQLALLIASFVPDYTGKICSNEMEDPQEYFRANFSNKKALTELGWIPNIPLSVGISELL